MARTAIILGLVLLLSPGPSWAQDEGSPYRVVGGIDWQRRVLVLRVELDLRKAGLRLPEGRLAAERLVARDLPGLAKDPFFEIPLDSRRSVGDSILDGTVDVSAILDLAQLLVRRGDSLSMDLGSYVSEWELPLGAATALYVRGTRASPLSGILEWKATKAFTGIVIYADTELPVHGERGITASLQEGLFPRIFDERMDVIVDRSTVEPAVLVAMGPLGYASRLGSEEEARVGDSPLRIRATEIFGINRTDLVIPRDEAEKILAIAANRRLVAEGKVIVIIEGKKSVE